LAALLAASIYAVHPVHAEVVNSIFNRSEMLVAISCLAGLTWLLRFLFSRPIRAWVGLSFAYLIALFCKESAAVFPVIAFVTVFILTPGDSRARFKKCLPVAWMLIPLVFYLGMRTQALTSPELTDAVVQGAQRSPVAEVVSQLDILEIPGGKRLSRIAGLWYQSFKIILWPDPLSVSHRGVSSHERFAAWAVIVALMATMLYMLKRRNLLPAMGLFFFFIAILPASRIIGDPSTMPHLAERYLYFPSVGLGLTLASGLHTLMQRFMVRATLIACLISICILAPITWNRNFAWASDIDLFESEYRNGNDDEHVLIWLAAAHLKKNNTTRVVELCEINKDVQMRSPKLSTNCALAYIRAGRKEDAEQAYLVGTTGDDSKTVAHSSLARLYLGQGHWQEAKLHFEQAIEAEKNPASRAFREGYMIVWLYPRDRDKLIEAKAKFEQSLELQPAFTPARRWLARVNRALGSQ
jgi:tetratricopeptide (TPR) repeat protein